MVINVWYLRHEASNVIAAIDLAAMSLFNHVNTLQDFFYLSLVIGLESLPFT